MWSKTRQALESRLPEDLKDRVKYIYEVMRVGSHGCKDHVFTIMVDGEPWFQSNPINWEQKLESIRDDGIVSNIYGAAMEFVHQFLNELSIDEAISHENYFIRLLAVLDARLGKRRIKVLTDNIGNEPEWFRKWILLRAGGTTSTGAQQETQRQGDGK